MGSGFARRYQSNPGLQELAKIEGTVVIDNAPPGTPLGVGSGTVGVVGEFVDMTYACGVNSLGVVVAKLRPVQILGPDDRTAKLGGFDAQLGDFGRACGNGHCELRRHRYAELVVCPVDVCTPTDGDTQYGVRLWRQLPTNLSATVPRPIVPMAPGYVAAGTEFTTAGHRVRTASAVTFTADSPRASGVDGTTIVGANTATATLQSVGGTPNNFIAAGVVSGDIVVVGSLAAAGGSANLVAAGTYRVRGAPTTTTTTGDTLTLEWLDGVSLFTAANWLGTVGTMAYRVHPAATADSAGVAALPGPASAVAGYTVLPRPLDADVAAATTVAPTVPPAAGTATAWVPLSGLTLRTHPTGAVDYDAVVHTPNATNSNALILRYQNAIDALDSDDLPAAQIDIVVSARKSSGVGGVNSLMTYLRQHCQTASSHGLGRTCCVSPELNQTGLGTNPSTETAVLSGVAPSPATCRDERLDYCWPGVLVNIPEAVGVPITGSDGTVTVDGNLDFGADGWLADLLSNLNPELNPGQEDPPVPTLTGSILGLQRGVSGLNMSDYILLKQFGIAAPRRDRDTGVMVFQSGITSSLAAGQTNINRRRYADFIQDTLTQIGGPFAKSLATQSRRDALLGEVEAFLAGQKSTDAPQLARCADYAIDDKTPNTPATLAANLYTIRVTVLMLSTMDVLVFDTTVGQGLAINQLQ